MSDLVPLPPHPDGLPWPTEEWPRGELPPGVDLEPLLHQAFVEDQGGRLGLTLAVLVVHRGRIVVERYGPDTDADTTLISWSMAKSMAHAAVGILAGEGRVGVDEPAAVPEWQEPGDPRRAITLEHMLEMRDGLAFVEDYVDDRISDVIHMLFGEGADDVAHFAADRPLAHPPGTHFNYSSGTSNIVSRIVGDLIGSDADSRRQWLQDRLFAPIGMRSAEPRFDAAGTWVASSYVYATAQDFARFGYLYLRDGIWDGRRLLPEGWVDHGRRPRPGSVDPDDGNLYGAHWWMNGDELGSFWASGYEGQRIYMVPALDLLFVRLGKTPAEHYADLKVWRQELVAQFSRLG